MLASLRAATGPAHRQLDSAFGALELAQRDELVRFLTAHAMALFPLSAAFRQFVENTLAVSCPDYPAMLMDDLTALGVDASTLPCLALTPGLVRDVAEPAAAGGIAYVLSGSRLGMAVIRREGYWGHGQGFRSAYMEDEQGHQCWKALLAWLRTEGPAPAAGDAMLAGALAGFEVFAQAFAASRDAQPVMPIATEQAVHG